MSVLSSNQNGQSRMNVLGGNITLPLNNSLGRSMNANLTALVLNLAQINIVFVQGSPTKKIDSLLKFGDGYAKQIERQKKVFEGLSQRITDIQSAIDNYRKEKGMIPKSNAGK